MSDLTFTLRPKSTEDYPMVAMVCAHWASLRTARALPARGALDPSAIAEALPHVLLAQYVSPGVARIRLCGHGIEDMMGMDLRGMPLTALFGAGARDEVMAALKQVGGGARAMLSLKGEQGFGQPEMGAQLALMPLTDTDGRITHVLGVLERHGQIGRRPRRFVCADVAPIVTEKAPTLRVITGGKG